VLRLANAAVLPYEFSDFSDTLSNYVREVMKLTDDLRQSTSETNRLISANVLAAAADPKEPLVQPSPKPDVPYLNFAPLENAVTALRKSAEKFEHDRHVALADPNYSYSASDWRSLDKQLLQLDRALIHPQGLPRRPWYRHLIYAPGYYTGYGVKTLPGIREAIEQRNWTEAAQQIDIAAHAIEDFASKLERVRISQAGTGR